MDKLFLTKLRRQIDFTINYLTPLLPLANCHMVDYLKSNHWKNLISKEIVNEVNDNGLFEAIDSFWLTKYHLKYKNSKNIFTPHLSETNKENICESEKLANTLKFPHLTRFIEEADLHCLSESDFCVTMDKLKKILKMKGADSAKSLKIREFMSSKKSHEVEMMSSLLATLYSWSGSSHVIDMGGGKGYLSAMLTMLYNIPVLNIDSSHFNATGAKNRNTKMQRVWSSIVKDAEAIKSGTTIQRKSRRCKNKSNPPDSSLKPDENIELNPVAQHKSDEVLNYNVSIVNKHLYRHVVKEITPETNLPKLVHENFEINSEDGKFCFTGLHTCGSLGSTSLKLFVECPLASVLCVVPCCYHLIAEQDNADQLYTLPENFPKQNADFPMSEYLKGFVIGRNARMLAAQSLERVVASQELPRTAIYYRTLIEVLLDEHFNGNPSYSKLKNIDDTGTFYNYVNIAVEKLKIDTDKFALDEKSVNEFEKLHSHHKKTLDLFYLLRMTLSPVVESLVLLDRLMYLAENGFSNQLGEAVLVRMFDCVFSPRCMALVAFRYDDKNNRKPS